VRANATSEQAAAASEERRRQNRAYMRRWRANAQHRRLELSQQQRWRLEQKLKLRMAPRAEKLCSYCHSRKAVTEMVRLRPAATGFEKVRIRYCGVC
jgi:hypothetical protein